MVDIWRICNPDTCQFTWKRTKPRLIMERIDYLLVSTNLPSSITKTEILPGYKAAHSFPAMTYLDIQERTKGNGYWKLNTSHLQDEDFVKEIKKIIVEVTKEHPDDIFLRWEMIKVRTRRFAIQFRSRKKQSNHNKILVLNKKLQWLEKQQASPPSHNNIQIFNDYDRQIASLRNELEEIIRYQTQGVQLRCQINWYDGCEKCSKYFLNMEKYLSNKKTITKLEDE